MNYDELDNSIYKEASGNRLLASAQAIHKKSSMSSKHIGSGESTVRHLSHDRYE